MDKYPPSQIDYTPFTHIDLFCIYPTATGNLRIGDMQFEQNVINGVRAAHAAGKKAILIIGGAGEGTNFVGATNDTNQTKFIQNILTRMKNSGYDGVDIDWEEQVTEGPCVTFITQLGTELNKTSPRPYYEFYVDSGQIPPSIAAKLYNQVDSINMMSYWFNGLDEFNAYTKAGIPANKLVLGIGISPDYHDLTAALVQKKVNEVKKYGMRGTKMWSFADLNRGWSDPRLQPLRDLVAGK
jgi:hypothetical protein